MNLQVSPLCDRGRAASSIIVMVLLLRTFRSSFLYFYSSHQVPWPWVVFILKGHSGVGGPSLVAKVLAWTWPEKPICGNSATKPT